MKGFSVKTGLSNFKSNVLLVVSTAAISGLCWSYVPRLNVFAILCLVTVLIGSFFAKNTVPFGIQAFSNKAAIVMTVLLETVMLLNFYDTYNHGETQRFIASFGLPAAWFWVAAGLLLAAIGFYAVYTLMDYVSKATRPFATILVKYRKSLLILAAIFCIGLCALIRSNTYYMDDQSRNVFGYQLTGSFSRYLSTFLSTFVHVNTFLGDASPLTQLLAACIMAVAAVILYAVITDSADMSVWGIAALVPMGLFPFFLECYSFKYDSPYMALSVLAAITPLIFYRKNPLKFGLAVAVGTVLMCTTYQASAGILPMLVAMLCLMMWMNKQPMKQIVSMLAGSAGGYVAGLLFFRFALMTSIESEYAEAGISISKFLPNIIQYFKLIYTRFDIMWTLFTLIIVVCFIVALVRDSKRNKLASALLTTCTLGVMAVLSYGVYSVLEKTLREPRAMYGFGVLISALCVVLAISKHSYIGKTAALVLGWMFLSFSVIYGNVFNMQNEYTDFRIEMVVEDIAQTQVLKDSETVYVQVTGSTGYADQVKNVMSEYPLLEDLIQIQFNESVGEWDNYALRYYYGLNDVFIRDASIDLTLMDLPVLKDTAFHTIRGEGNYILIELKE